MSRAQIMTKATGNDVPIEAQRQAPAPTKEFIPAQAWLTLTSPYSSVESMTMSTFTVKWFIEDLQKNPIVGSLFSPPQYFSVGK